jgi:hypothetical protein
VGQAADIERMPEDTKSAVFVRRGMAAAALSEKIFPEKNGAIRITIPEVTRLAVYLNEKDASETQGEMEARGRRILAEAKTSSGRARYEAYAFVLGRLQPLPIGASFEPIDGVLYWQPGPGFLGEFGFMVIDRETGTKRNLRVTIKAK